MTIDQDEKSLFYVMILTYLNKISNEHLSLIKQKLVSQDFAPAPILNVFADISINLQFMRKFVWFKVYCWLMMAKF